MRKLFAIILSVAILMGLAGCGGNIQDILGAAVKYAESDTEQYNKILSDADIEHSAPIFGENTASYVKKDDKGNILCTDYVYKNDVVTSWAETTYIPVQGLSESQIFDIEMTVRENLSFLEVMECCSVRYNQPGDYLKVTCVFTDVDKEENYSALYRAELTTEESAVSMKVSEDLVLEEGYVKK